jgi:hypothetical protein
VGDDGQVIPDRVQVHPVTSKPTVTSKPPVNRRSARRSERASLARYSLTYATPLLNDQAVRTNSIKARSKWDPISTCKALRMWRLVLITVGRPLSEPRMRETMWRFPGGVHS